MTFSQTTLLTLLYLQYFLFDETVFAALPAPNSEPKWILLVSLV
jgi:hypothetical protein